MNTKNLKRMLCWILTVTMVLGLIPSTVLAIDGNGFKDVKDGDWFKEAVEYVTAEGLMTGVGRNKFVPNGQTTRAMVVTVLHRMEGAPTTNGAGFNDVAENLWYTDAIDWAQANGIVEGYGDGSFRPDVTMTREEMVAVFFRYSEYKRYDTTATKSLTAYSDRRSIQTFAVDAMGWAVSVGLITGFPDGTIRPQGQSTRAQLATVLMRYCRIISSEIDTHTVCFNLSIEGIIAETDKSLYAPQKIADGKTIDQPADPIPIVGEFTGWFTTETCDIPFDFSAPVSSDIVVYAGWRFDTTDLDGDGLPDEVEDYLGLDPTTDDTDGDGLKDRLEMEISTDPTLVDTDNDSVSDYDEDYDRDGLSNGVEVQIGTSPLYKDTDLDWMSDSEEQNRYKTNPVNEDSDGDGAKDGWEIKNGFDPLVYNDAFVVEELAAPISEYNPVSASVALELPGDKAATVEITPVDISDCALISATIPGYLGQAYDFNADATFETAVLKFTYDTSLGTIGDEFQPRIYYFNETEGTFEELPNQTVENGCVTATVSHFSAYILLNKVEFDKVWEEEIRSPDDMSVGMTGLDVVFVIDSSGSMKSNDRNRLRIAAAKEFVSKLGKDDRAAVIDFDSSAWLLQGFTNDHDLLNTAIESIDSSGGTNLGRGMNMAINQFTSDQYTRSDAYKYVVFLTDGNGSYSSSYTEIAAENDIVVYTIGLGSDVDDDVLMQIAEGTGGKYYFASAADDLPNIYDDVSFETVDYKTDSNNDGLSDYYTQLIYEGKLRPSNGSGSFRGINFNYDKNGNVSDDYDGDGLKNGEEVAVFYNETTNRVYLTILSDPTLVHSDNDGVNDYIEWVDGQDPLKEDYYKKSSVNSLLNDDSFYYEGYVDMFDNNSFYQADSAFLGAITGLWNPVGLCRELMIDYFDEYGEATGEIEETSQDIQEDIWIDNLDRLLGIADKVYDNLDTVSSIKEDIGNIIDVVRGHSGITEKKIAEMYYAVVTKLSVYVDDLKVLEIKEITVGKATVTALEKSPIKTFDTKGLGISIGFDAISGMIDIADTLSSFAEVYANYAILSQNIDFLYEMYEYGNRDVIKYAAEDLINLLGEGYEKVINKAVGQDIAEMGLDIAITVASCNPYVGAVTFVVDMLNLFTGLNDTIEREYQMVCYSSMVDSLSYLISDASSYRGNYRYDSEGKLARYLIHLAQIRILGEKKYIDYYSHGMNSWFTDEDDLANRVNSNINWIKEEAKLLHLKLYKTL